eukprot:gene2976-biopygen5711
MDSGGGASFFSRCVIVPLLPHLVLRHRRGEGEVQQRHHDAEEDHAPEQEEGRVAEDGLLPEAVLLMAEPHRVAEEAGDALQHVPRPEVHAPWAQRVHWLGVGPSVRRPGCG